MKRNKLLGCVAGLATSLFIAAYFTATQPISPNLSLVSALSVIIFALPTYITVIRIKGIKLALLLLISLGAYALIVESLALKYGFPYGTFIYTDLLGNKLFGLVPWTVIFAYPPILLLGYLVARKTRKKPWHILIVTAAVATACDIVLDPAAVRLGFWHWTRPGFFYGVPLINFGGWLLSGFVGAIFLHRLYGKARVPRGLAYSGLAIVWFWALVNVCLGQWVPAVIGIIISVFLTKHLLQNTATIKG